MTSMTATRVDNVTHLVRPRRALAPTSFQGTLALDLGPEQQLEPPTPLATGAAALRGADLVAVEPRTRHDLQRWVHTFSQAAVEAARGLRPVSQLLRWTTPGVHHELTYRSGVMARATVHGPGQAGRPQVRPQVQSVHLSFLGEETVEFSARVRHGERSRCLAGRLEVLGGRWQATALEFG
ncbi:Rv3235 family protein [Nocardioides sp. AE5]|uniref:Rv3235 family protein n=1 Tax=Nocardioides sp. AE5 TaxID=2962573 RepID=UPI002882051F|nr:Rv3235 family protein [Nocardioides sp. AE5]MDT0202091.1 Rv3235 family protein [Nocardioides sp. AE5]